MRLLLLGSAVQVAVEPDGALQLRGAEGAEGGEGVELSARFDGRSMPYEHEESVNEGSAEERRHRFAWREVPEGEALPAAPAPAAPSWRVPPEVAIGMLSTPKEPWAARSEQARQTWGKYFTSFAGYTMDAVPPDDWRVRLDPVNRNETFMGMALGMIPEMLRRFPKAQWLVQTDDDTLLFPQSVLQFCRDRDATKPLLTGVCNSENSIDKQRIPFIIGGGGIFFSRKLAEDLAPHVPQCRAEFAARCAASERLCSGDNAIGVCLEQVYGADRLRGGADTTFVQREDTVDPGLAHAKGAAAVAWADKAAAGDSFWNKLGSLVHEEIKRHDSKIVACGDNEVTISDLSDVEQACGRWAYGHPPDQRAVSMQEKDVARRGALWRHLVPEVDARRDITWRTVYGAHNAARQAAHGPA